jgi:hypothetical protein
MLQMADHSGRLFYGVNILFEEAGMKKVVVLKKGITKRDLLSATCCKQGQNIQKTF